MTSGSGSSTSTSTSTCCSNNNNNKNNKSNLTPIMIKKKHQHRRATMTSTLVGGLLLLLLVASVALVLFTSWDETYGSGGGGMMVLIPKRRSSSSSTTATASVRNDGDSSSSPVNAIRNRTIVIHVGPHKHGTTYLQCALTDPIVDDALRADNWVYLGRNPDLCNHHYYHHHHHNNNNTANVTDDDFEKDDDNYYPVKNSMNGIFTGRNNRIFAPDATLRPSFTQAMDRLAASNSNAIIISEDLMILSPYMANMLIDYLHNGNGNNDDNGKGGWNVHIVINYRPLYEYLPSLYSQRMKPGTRQTHLPWPDEEKGRTILPFDLAHRDKFSAEIIPQVEHGLSKPYQAKVMWGQQKPQMQRIDVIDMSNLTITSSSTTSALPQQHADPLLHNFLCEIVSTAPTACGVVPRVSQQAYSNPSFQINYDLLAVAAYERGWLGPTATEKTVGSAEAADTAAACAKAVPRLETIRLLADFQMSHNKTATNLPLKCLPNNTLERLFSVSLHADRVLFPEALDNQQKQKQRERHLRRGFDKQVLKKKFCWVDIGKTLEGDSVLVAFLKKLGKEFSPCNNNTRA